MSPSQALALAPAPWAAFALALAGRPRVARPELDVELVRRASSGDRHAYDQLYTNHVDAVYRRLTRLIGPVAEREDLVQEVFLDVFRGLPRFRAESTFSTWLHRVVVNIACEHLRRVRRRPLASIHPEALEQLLAPGASPEAQALERDQLQCALRYLAALKPKQRIAFVLRVVEGLPLEEIATLTGARAPAVGQRVKHALKHLAAMAAREQKRSRT